MNDKRGPDIVFRVVSVLDCLISVVSFIACLVSKDPTAIAHNGIAAVVFALWAIFFWLASKKD